MVTLRKIKMLDYVEQAAAMANAHWLETESGFSATGPRLALDIYRALEDAGAIIAFGAFDGETLVGYCVSILSPHLHYGFTYAHHDLLYLQPAYRRGALALRLIRSVHDEARKAGAQCATWHAKCGTPMARILDRMIGKPDEHIYIKEL